MNIKPSRTAVRLHDSELAKIFGETVRLAVDVPQEINPDMDEAGLIKGTNEATSRPLHTIAFQLPTVMFDGSRKIETKNLKIADISALKGLPLDTTVRLTGALWVVTYIEQGKGPNSRPRVAQSYHIEKAVPLTPRNEQK